MKTIVTLLALILFSSAANAAINPETGVDYAKENDAAAGEILATMTQQERINAAQLYFLKLWQPNCKTTGGQLHLLSIKYADDGMTAITCGEQELTQIRFSNAGHIEVAFHPGDWVEQSNVHELCMFSPDKCAPQFRNTITQ